MDFADISGTWQPDVDLGAYRAAGYDTISLKATEGGAFVDPLFLIRWRTAAQLGLTRWAYHFAQPGNAAADAEHFLNVLNQAGGVQGLDRLMLDFESPAWSNAGAWADARMYAIEFFQRLRQLAPNQPMLIYSYYDYEKNSHVERADLPDVGLAIASYGSGFSLPPGWDHACLWQFTDGVNGRVMHFPGIGAVDGNTQLCALHDCGPSEEDELNDADWAKLTQIVKGAVSDGVKAELTLLVGKRATPTGAPSPDPATVSNVVDALWLMSHGDATHPWSLTALKASADDTSSRIANLQTGAVDPASVKAALVGLKIEGAISE